MSRKLRILNINREIHNLPAISRPCECNPETLLMVIQKKFNRFCQHGNQMSYSSSSSLYSSSQNTLLAAPLRKRKPATPILFCKPNLQQKYSKVLRGFSWVLPSIGIPTPLSRNQLNIFEEYVSKWPLFPASLLCRCVRSPCRRFDSRLEC